MKTFENNIPFKDTLLENADLMKYLTVDEINKLFNFDNMLKNVDYIFGRCGLD